MKIAYKEKKDGKKETIKEDKNKEYKDKYLRQNTGKEIRIKNKNDENNWFIYSKNDNNV